MRASPYRRFSVAAGGVFLVVLTTGCTGSGGGGAGKGEPALGPVAVNPPTSSLVLPMDAYTDSEAEAARMGRIQEGLVGRCMARFGFAYEGVSGPASGGGGAAEDRHAYLFGVADPAYAAAHGYDKTAGAGRRSKPAPPKLSDSATTVLTGRRPGSTEQGPEALTEEAAVALDSGIEVGGRKVPVGGCGREAYRTLYAPTEDSVDLLFSFGLAAEAHDRAKGDSRVVAVLRTWSDCMDKSGYSGISSPYQVIEKLGLEGDLGGAKAVAAATADVACKREVNLVGVWAAVEKAHQERLAEENAETLALYAKQREARFRLAAQLS